jgi:GAF domain-containing protein
MDTEPEVIAHLDAARVEAAIDVLTTTARGATLEEAVELAVRSSHELFRLAGTGVMVADGAEVLRYIAASDERARLLEEAQERTGIGPCVDAVVSGEVVATADVTDDPRWPELGALLEGHAVHGVLGIPIHVDDRPVGSVNVYAAEPLDWDERDIAAMRSFGEVLDGLIGTSIAQRQSSELVRQLQHALDRRVEIERAIGVLMERDGLDGRAAFERLRGAARSRREKVAAVARRVLEGRPID